MSLLCKLFVTNLAVVLDEKSVALLQGAASPLGTEWEFVMEAGDEAGLLSYAWRKLIRIEGTIF